MLSKEVRLMPSVTGDEEAAARVRMTAQLAIVAVSFTSFALASYWIYIGNLIAVWPTAEMAYKDFGSDLTAAHVTVFTVWLGCSVFATATLVVVARRSLISASRLLRLCFYAYAWPPLLGIYAWGTMSSSMAEFYDLSRYELPRWSVWLIISAAVALLIALVWTALKGRQRHRTPQV